MRIGIILMLVALLWACDENKDREKTISVSILPQRYFVERIAGDYVKVNVMIPPGANPAVSDLSTEQLKALHNSSIYFAVGYLPFEISNLYPFLEKQEKHIQLVKQSEGMELEEGTCDCGHHHTHPGNFDPHVWMSPRYAGMMAQTICKVLSEKFPEKKTEFEQNFKQFKQEIDSIDAEARRIIPAKQNKTFLIYHPALTYLAKDYGMEQIAIEDEGKEPNPSHIKAVVDTCRAKGIKIVFIQNQFDVMNAKAIAREIDGEVIAIDPLSADWKKEMESLLRIIEQKME
ncbi:MULTISPECIES: metal ABC transporter solute-binding protein, Zn/Mn family [Butyricimonas]|uniref:Zinc ABC transporter substrate-binding protein n=1 Tax=Butyricimonas hominis TaxID=2763032 RepID=A0ABR7D500_9BACT|nr:MULTISPECIES: zinc ABC transporter substrate-binding protein [Butyricimonas]MBC5623033.1 zinc ABC transporter substrate-binding protein [Butyricimonas hominis]MCB6974442.1 zinc ABC transporter substrate-binding protein [Butyricimonas synergistica]MCG4521194.1 zinc ABC transporter substrate-binding protein [Butyricimonas sp. DFI.6.44]